MAHHSRRITLRRYTRDSGGAVVATVVVPNKSAILREIQIFRYILCSR